jgi:hypothetical protein
MGGINEVEKWRETRAEISRGDVSSECTLVAAFGKRKIGSGEVRTRRDETRIIA